MALIDYSMDMYGSYMWPHVKFLNWADEHALPYFINKKWPNREFDSDKAQIVFESEFNKAAFFTDDAGAYYLSTSNGEVQMTVAAKTQERAEKIIEHIKTIAPVFEETAEDKVEVTFWSLGNQGPQSIARSLVVPTWEEILGNYTEPVGDQLATFMDENWRPSIGGRLILWHGEPGTGKTTALRALARHWRQWCEIHYITDPEQFFGASAAYMMSVLVNSESMTNDKWRLLVLEDCGELIAADAKSTSGQGLSRLLNTVDGLIGQGLRFQVLITTNEPFKKLNEAVTRPGRTLSDIEFNKLSADEVRNWLAAHKLEIDHSVQKQTIAELYAKSENFVNKKVSSQKLGFTT